MRNEPDDRGNHLLELRTASVSLRQQHARGHSGMGGGDGGGEGSVGKGGLGQCQSHGGPCSAKVRIKASGLN